MADRADIAGGRLRPDDYARSFGDLHPPLDPHHAVVEASRCYFCNDALCIEACPTGIDIPSFIRKIATGNLEGSATDILSANIMGGTCARVCPTEVPCERASVRNGQDQRPVQIGLLQRHATDWLFGHGIQPFERALSTGKRVAVVGAGPAGLACPHGCTLAGHGVVVFEARDEPGGLDEYGIAAYKVNDFAGSEVDFITETGGIEIRTGRALGRVVQLADLRRDFDVVFPGIGLGGVASLGLGGEHLSGVESAVAYFARLRQADDGTQADGRRPGLARWLPWPGGRADRAPRGGGHRPRPRASRLAKLGHRWHRDPLRRRGVSRVELRLGAGLHGCHALRLRDRRRHDRRPRQLDGPRGLHHARRLPRPGDAEFRGMAGSRSRLSERNG